MLVKTLAIALTGYLGGGALPPNIDLHQREVIIYVKPDVIQVPARQKILLVDAGTMFDELKEILSAYNTGCIIRPYHEYKSNDTTVHLGKNPRYKNLGIQFFYEVQSFLYKGNANLLGAKLSYSLLDNIFISIGYSYSLYIKAENISAAIPEYKYYPLYTYFIGGDIGYIIGRTTYVFLEIFASKLKEVKEDLIYGNKEYYAYSYELGLRGGIGAVILKIHDRFQIDGNISLQRLKISKFDKVISYDLNSVTFQIGIKWNIAHIF